jgi:hypothetical protein
MHSVGISLLILIVIVWTILSIFFSTTTGVIIKEACSSDDSSHAEKAKNVLIPFSGAIAFAIAGIILTLYTKSLSHSFRPLVILTIVSFLLCYFYNIFVSSSTSYVCPTNVESSILGSLTITSCLLIPIIILSVIVSKHTPSHTSLE